MPRAVHLKAGTVLFRVGEAGDVAYFIEKGRVRIYSSDGPDAVVLGEHGRGQLVGEMAIIDGGARSATVVALEDCTLYGVSRDQITKRLETVDPVIRACLETILVRFRAAMSTVRELRAEREATVFTSAPCAIGGKLLDSAAKSLELENDILSGLEDGQFDVHFQPVVRLNDRQLHGFEALIRWDHPTLGRISPARFIPVAEASGLMPQITTWMVEAALDGLRTIDLALSLDPGSRKAPRLNVNLSAHDLAQPEQLMRHLREATRSRAIPPWRVTLEITETALMANEQEAADCLHALKALGFGVAIDDFGTGYANLSYVRVLPATVLKLDRSFINAVSEDAITQRLVKSVLSLGQDLDMKVVAEGLERPEDIQTLQDMGCLLGQGYAFAKPMDTLAAAKWARDSRNSGAASSVKATGADTPARREPSPAPRVA